MITRRSFLSSILASCVAPAFIPRGALGILMPTDDVFSISDLVTVTVTPAEFQIQPPGMILDYLKIGMKQLITPKVISLRDYHDVVEFFGKP